MTGIPLYSHLDCPARVPASCIIFGMLRQRLFDPLNHGYNQDDKGHILPAQWQHYILLLI